jgi:hypothetical protein
VTGELGKLTCTSIYDRLKELLRNKKFLINHQCGFCDIVLFNKAVIGTASWSGKIIVCLSHGGNTRGAWMLSPYSILCTDYVYVCVYMSAFGGQAIVGRERRLEGGRHHSSIFARRGIMGSASRHPLVNNIWYTVLYVDGQSTAVQSRLYAS